MILSMTPDECEKFLRRERANQLRRLCDFALEAADKIAHYFDLIEISLLRAVLIGSSNQTTKPKERNDSYGK